MTYGGEGRRTREEYLQRFSDETRHECAAFGKDSNLSYARLLPILAMTIFQRDCMSKKKT